MAQTTRQTNGVDLERVRAVKTRIGEDEETARPRFAARVTWLGGYRTESLLGGHTIVRGDEPTAYAGEDTGPSPEDMLLAAVGQCLSVGYAGSLAARDIPIQRLEITVSGRVDFRVAYGLAEGNPGFDRIEVEVDLQADAPREVLEAVHERVLREAPIPNTVSRPVELDARLV